MLNIGNRPTLDNGDGISIEVHLLHFKGDLYNQPLRLLFGNRVRDEHRFGSLEELQLQLRQDAVSAELLLG
jgi:riboflavin kinase/FMN adenylyltransferase